MNKTKTDVKQTTNNFTFGMELELGDIDKRTHIPLTLGAWEGKYIDGYHIGREEDILNILGSSAGVAVDPNAKMTVMGGEINVAPTLTAKGQFNRVMEIFNHFPHPTITHLQNFHCHVHVPKANEDLALLQKIAVYIEYNQEAFVQATVLDSFDISSFQNFSSFNVFTKDVITHSRFIPLETFSGIRNADTIENALEELDHSCFGWDGAGEFYDLKTSRAAINLKNLMNNKTIEFRSFRASMNPIHIYSELRAVERFAEEMIKGSAGKPFSEILKEENFSFAPLQFNRAHHLDWVMTTHTDDDFTDDSLKYAEHNFAAPNDEFFTDYSAMWNSFLPSRFE